MSPSRYDALVKFYADRFNVPEQLALAQMEQESGGNPVAKSPVGALGLFQVMPSTAAWLETFPEPACCSGQFYLRRLHDEAVWAKTEEDRWQFALAEYNGGPGTIAKARAAAIVDGRVGNVWSEVQSYCPLETMHYVSMIWQVYQGSLFIDPEITM